MTFPSVNHGLKTVQVRDIRNDINTYHIEVANTLNPTETAQFQTNTNYFNPLALEMDI